MIRSGHFKKLLRKAGLGLLLVSAIVGFGYWNRTWTSKGRVCRICGAGFTHKTVLFYGMPVWAWDTEIEGTSDTRNYFDRYLGYPHEHEWTGGGYSRHGRGFVGCGRSVFGPYPQYQMELTQMGFKLVAASGMEDPKLRRRYFESIIQPSDVEHYWRVTKTHDAIDDQIPKEPWMKREPYRVWGPDMKDIQIPDYVRAGELTPDPL